MTEKKMQLVDWLDDLCVRFIINLPQEELESVERICFQIEEAQWFYEDFIRPADPSLPQLGLSEFASRLMKHCPLTAGYSNDLHALAFKQFMAYKTRVPVRGAILLNEDMDKVLLVKGYKKNATWSFPRGKINKDEDDLVCAIREVWEETGYDLDRAGLVPKDRNVHCIDVTMREQHLRMFVFRSVPLDTPFEPQTRKEISKIQWYKLSSLPTFSNKRRSQHVVDTGDPDAISASKLYMVAPFLHSLKKWINQQKKLNPHRLSAPLDPQDIPSDVPQEDYPVQPLQVDITNPADELKRLLALGSSAPPTMPSMPSQYTAAPPEGQQADALLAMLRGSSSNLAAPMGPTVPRTPMEQILSQPNQPQSPHVQHVRSSPHTTRMPPPDFPLSPNHRSMQDTNRSFGQLDLNGHSNMHPGNMPFMNHPSQQLPYATQPQSSHMAHFTQGHPMPQLQNQTSQQHGHPSANFQDSQQMASLQPQGHGAIAHGPAAPKASQLPPPNMSSHTMNLLNVLKTPSRQPLPMHSQSQMQHFPTGHAPNQHGQMLHPSGMNGNNSSTTQMLHPSTSLQHNQTGPAPQAVPSRSNHQNSLLDLFKSPTAQKAVLATHDEQSQQRETLLPPPLPRAEPERVAIEPAQRRASTVAMMTRTLPKTRPMSPQKQNPVGGVGGMGPELQAAKEARKQVQTPPSANLVADTSKHEVEEGISKPPFKILARPGSRPGSASAPAPAPKIASTPLRNATSSPRKSRSQKTSEHTAPQTFTILQRPSPNKPAGSAIDNQTPDQTPVQGGGASTLFQPQLLRRPKDSEMDTTGAIIVRKGSHAPSGGDQRDTLLALFAKSGQGKNKAVDPVASRVGPSSSGSASPLPVDPTAFRSRIASNASNRDGMRSPVTPVETKGFLMDYLNGVVKGEQQRGAKRGQ